MFKSGFVTIVGRPNVGKSTFVNAVLKEKIAIMSDKVQTTRNNIQGIYTDQEAQIVFIDTPGIHKPKHQLGSVINSMATSTIDDVDIVLFMVPFNEKIGDGDRFILNRFSEETKVFLLINKIDLAVKKNLILEKIAEVSKVYNFAEIIPISAMKLENIDYLIEIIKTHLDEGVMYYPAEYKTNHSEEFLIREIIREKVLHLTKEEVPHSVAVVLDQYECAEDGIIEIRASIIVERKSQKGIIIGNQGSMIKTIGSRARKEIKKKLKNPVYLELWVKVENDWRNNNRNLDEFGYKIDY